MLITLSILALLAAFFVLSSDPDQESTGNLYSYRRTSDRVTRITVQASAPGAGEIDPRIFSNFLEHLGGTIYDGLWANVIGNPQFEADKRGSLARWSRSGKAQWSKDGLSGRYIALSADSAVSQLITLPVHRQRGYPGSLWCRTTSGSPAVIQLILRRQDKPRVIAAAKIEVRSAAWSSHRFELLVPESGIEKSEPVELRIECREGAASVDMVELFPADHVDGVDPDVLRLSKELRIELLRWPGGNFVSGYRWRDGIGPREKRPTKPNPAWAGLETHHFGTDEYIRFCRAIGAKPMICVNAGDGTPEEAADWVEYCNGPASSPMGSLRAKNGHPESYNVRVWEIGNELYGDWQIGRTDAKGNAERYLRFREAMLARDPSIEIIATGRGDAFTQPQLGETSQWNAVLLEAARSTKAPPDFISLHPLVPLPHNLSRFSYAEVFESVMAHPTWWSQSHVVLRRQIEKTRIDVPKSNTELAVTEWGLIVGGPQWLRYPNHDEQSGAVYAALFYNAMLRLSDFVRIGNVTALLHGGGIKRPNQVAYVDPMYHVEKLYGVARPNRLLGVEVEGPGYDVPQRGLLPAVKNVPLLDVIAAESGSDRLLFIVNRDLKQARTADIFLPDAARRIEAEQVSAAPRTRNSPRNPAAVKPVRYTFSVGSKPFRREFPPCSFTLLRWK